MKKKDDPKQPTSKNKIIILLICCIAIFLIFAQCFIRCKIGTDFFQLKIPLWDFDLWSLTHLLFYFFLTYIFPNEWLFIFFVGVLWEVIENWLGGFNPKNMSALMGRCALDQSEASWWYGKFSDILVNLAGIGLALLAHKCFRKEKKVTRKQFNFRGLGILTLTILGPGGNFLPLSEF